MTFEEQIVEQVERGNDLEDEVKRLKSDKHVNGIKADAIEVFVRDCNEASFCLSFEAMQYCDKLRNK